GEIVEQATTLEFFDEPFHPAGAALLATQRRTAQDIFALRGLPVETRALPAGCWLQARCPFAAAEAGCASDHPPLYGVGAGHRSRCPRHQAVREAVREHLYDAAPLAADDEPRAAEAGTR